MNRLMLAAMAAGSLVFLGPGTLRAAGEPDSNPRQTGGAAPGHKFGTEADVTAKKQADQQKYQNPMAGSASGARQQSSSSKQKE